MAHHLRLGQSGQADLTLAPQAAQPVLTFGDGGQVHATTALLALLENQGLVQARRP